MKTFDLSDRYWMLRALQLASLADGNTSPNPMVGAVVLDKQGSLVGEGFHSRAGEPHAEVLALRQAKEKSIGGTLIVTLEPCCHKGLTPPCTEAILAAEIIRVVIAINDPDPRVAGSGVAKLREAGIEVITGVLAAEAAHQNRSFLHRVRYGRPWGILKWAMSLDGRTALKNGESKWISSDQSRDWVHQLRGNCDAVVIGGGTLRTDNPLLTSRGNSECEPIRVVLTRSMDLPKEAKLWDLAAAQTLIAHGPEFDKGRNSQIPKSVERLPLDACEPLDLMNALAKKGCNRILWECGPSLATAAIKQGCVQELAVVMAPKILGGISARTPLAEIGISSMDAALVLNDLSFKTIGMDLLAIGSLPCDVFAPPP